MKILVISSILPVPGIISNNDFVFQIYRRYNQQYRNDTVVIFKPVKYDLNFSRLIKRSTRLNRLERNFSRNIHNFQVEILPYLSSWGYRNIHSIITGSIYYLNKRRITAILKEHHFDVIHAQYILPDGILACILNKKFNIPYFITTHNERFYFDHSMSRKVALKIFKNAIEVLPINYSNFQYYKSAGITNIEFIPLGFDRSFLREQRISLQERIKILTVAELIKLKNIDQVIRAIKMLVPKYNILYTIIGRGPEKESLQHLVDSLEIGSNVSFIDNIPHNRIADEMYTHDIFIMPSYFETFGRVYFEAMAMGIPIICAKNSGIHGFYKDMEEGISVNHKDLTEIKDSLEFLISNPESRLKIGINGKKLIENYTWENIAERLHDKFEQIQTAIV